MKKLIVFFTLLLITLFSCYQKGNSDRTDDELMKIEIGPDDLVDEINLSQIIDDFYLVQLETNENCLIGNINKIVCYKNYILVFDLFNQTLFLYNENGDFLRKISKHQGGPLGEGKIIDGCITCPWHGYQYLPHNGQSPPPFTEKVSTYEVKLEGKTIYINQKAFEEGTDVKPCNY